MELRGPLERDVMGMRRFVVAAVVAMAALLVTAAAMSGRDPPPPVRTAAPATKKEQRSEPPPGPARELWEVLSEEHLRLGRLHHAPLLGAPRDFELPELPEGALHARAYQYVSRIFERPAQHPVAVGFVRRGIRLPARERVQGPGCAQGSWYRLEGVGHVCSRDGFSLSTQPKPIPLRQRLPTVSEATPFRYGKIENPHALRFHHIPSEPELAKIEWALANDQKLPAVVSDRLRGIHLLALDRIEPSQNGKFYRTVRGRYVRAEDLALKPVPAMRGEPVRGMGDLPLAFMYGEQKAEVLAKHGDGLMGVGRIAKHARFRVVAETQWHGRTVVVSPDGLGVVRSRVRLAHATARPSKVGASDKWIHVNLAEQTLVAYQGDRPVLATLVSSGKGEAHATPTGLFRVTEKHVSVTMRGPDPDSVYYEVEEVPWTQFYMDGFALHGAYWHNEFGNTRSHGCVNISPVDARWLFYWSDGQVPAGWHARRGLRGTWVYLTNG